MFTALVLFEQRVTARHELNRAGRFEDRAELGDRAEHNAARTESAVLAQPDPEKWYQHGAIMAFCGKKEIALKMIGRAIQQNYCAFSALQSDPLLVKLRSGPEFNELLAAAATCQDTVLAAK